MSARRALLLALGEFPPAAVPDRAGLSAELLAGRLSLATPGLLARLRATTLAKLANDSPKYASLAAARARTESESTQQLGSRMTFMRKYELKLLACSAS